MKEEREWLKREDGLLFVCGWFGVDNYVVKGISKGWFMLVFILGMCLVIYKWKDCIVFKRRIKGLYIFEILFLYFLIFYG